MPIFKITQQQGNRSITSTLEADSASDIKSFLEAVSTAEVKYIYQVHYEKPNDNFPVDDFNYNKQFKAFCSNSARVSKQILLHNVKKTLNEAELCEFIKQYLKVGGSKISSLSCSLFMEK